jgi:hypothetical protein
MTTSVRLKLWQVSRRELHKVTCSLHVGRLMAVLELRNKVLTCEVVVEVDEYGHGLCEEWVWRRKGGV